MRLTETNEQLTKDVNFTILAVQDCPPGTFSGSGTNDIGCIACPAGEFQPLSKKTGCLPVNSGYQVSMVF
jgi:hypothetical protein